MIKNEKVLALKYRPKIFKDLVGQEVISETIFNSIKTNRASNAYLFTGIRGVGKTTFARIVAKSFNCENGIAKLCSENLCKNCEQISNSNHIDVLELDAASRTGVDDVRELIEFSRYGPTTAKYKIFIIDEVHMLSKQAFNALLKTLEEPPEYLKFIFATTEIKKIPVTVISRCQRFDLSRVNSDQLFHHIKKIKEKEKGKIDDEALKLIIKISEGSVRDALSLLDRALISNNEKGQNIGLKEAQKIFGYFDKGHLIKIFEHIFNGDEKSTISLYRLIYNQGIEPKVFLNDFLEILYFIKNISSIKLEGTNFNLNDEEFKSIELLSKKIPSDILLLFWQFTIKALSELEIVSNQNLSIEMFLIRLLYIKDNQKNKHSSEILNDNVLIGSKKNDEIKQFEDKKDQPEVKNKTVNQIKNFAQEEMVEIINKPEAKENDIKIENLNELINACNKQKDFNLRYELETNVNLVSFANEKIEISFNENLAKDFVKNLSLKLYEWTGKRWIISFSKEKGAPSLKEEKKIKNLEIINEQKKDEIYKKVTDTLNDAELIEVEVDEK